MNIKAYMLAILVINSNASDINSIDLMNHAAIFGLPTIVRTFATPQNMYTLDSKGGSLIPHAISGAFTHKNMDAFREIIKIIKHNKGDLDRVMSLENPTPCQHNGMDFASIMAVASLYSEPVDILCQEEVNPFAKRTGEKQSPFERILALSEVCEDAHKVVHVMGKYATNIHDAAKALNSGAIARLATRENVNSANSERKTALFYAIRYGHLAKKCELNLVIKRLVELGANPNSDLVDTPVPGFTYMHFATPGAALTEKLNVLEALLANGGSPRSGRSSTAYDMAESEIHPYYSKVRELFDAHEKK